LEDYMNFALAGLQVIIIPLTILGVICAFKHRRDIREIGLKLANTLSDREKYKENKRKLLNKRESLNRY
jgi:hypothetical protein